REGGAALRVIPRLHVVTDDEVLAREDFTRRAREVLEAGGAGVALHVRGPASTGAVLHGHARSLRVPARAAGARLLVNDRVDVALALALDGVHLGERSLPVAAVRALLGPDRWIGRSVHSPEAASQAERDGADFLFVGTIFPTPSHPGRPGAGPALLEFVARQCRLPLIAIGGITPDRVRELPDPETRGVAVLRGVWDTPRPADAVRRYLDAVPGY
ncbi:MAG: thiamine phosphate synthase, partial [Gemmatimonadota bacterium]